MTILTYFDFSMNFANSYYLHFHSNENTSSILVSPTLDHKITIGGAINAHSIDFEEQKKKIIDESLPKPSIYDHLYAPWIRCNIMILAWIHQSLSE
ncbi:hypothetical protein MTR_4g130480 [Medicago truncatula]|uniref:Uncharacterized protein n=1 Tax=Medicago truncatula TaxID=3880 RepID=G7JFJ3_MEDTR|nr:hypothetical protein MTR_4g130480 [Medicago truncatula]